MKKEKEGPKIISGNYDQKEITEELQNSYLDYAMSVIVGRALPDVRDGLKPVHRRILWAMWESGLSHQAKFRKSANIVGEVLGKYHPHGDSSVYEAMVRMAQDFELRYPLVEGQGNFGCFTKDTKVKLTDNRNLSFEDLIKEHGEGKKNYTYTVNSMGLISIAEIKNPRLTIKNAEIMKVVLDNGEEIKCTLNHLFMTKSGVYKKAKDLKSGESLMPLYEKLSEKTDRLNREGYILIYQNKTDEWVPAHHLADNYNLTAKKYSKKDGRVRHHLDFNKLNNSPDNIQRVNWNEHWRIHYEQASNLHKNKEYREKIAEGRKKFWSNPTNKAEYAKRISKQNFKNWQNPEYREKMREFLSVANKNYIQNHPEKRIEISKRATQTLKRLWQDPVYRKLFHEKIVSANKKRITNYTGKVKFLKICREVLKEYKILNQNLYEQKRRAIYNYSHATSWQTGIQKYYSNNKNILLNALNKNHKVIKIEFLDKKEDVYDLTIEKSHNFALAAGVFVHNSIDGDSAAAYRYTEARLSKIAEELLTDIDKETVDWEPNYDNRLLEPKVLPAKLPNLIINGSYGIAVGMATNIPPHNLNEVIDATLYLIENPKSDVEDIMPKFIKGPDFPTGGIIFDQKMVIEAYKNGRGNIPIRAKTEIVEQKNNQFKILITEIPYQVNKSELIKKIAELVQEKKIEDIKDLRDESDKDGLQIAVDLKNNSSPQKVLNQLFKHTELQKNFNLNMLVLTTGGLEPQVYSIIDVLNDYLDYRKIVIRRRTEFDLKKAKERAHILEGLSKALNNIDAVIKTIKKSKNREDAKENLIKSFKLSDRQADAILEMKLQTLAALEREKIESELKEKYELIKKLESILKSPKEILKIIKSELSELKEKYPSERKTQAMTQPIGEFREEDLIPNEDTVIALSKDGYIKRMSPDIFRSQSRGGKGLNASSISAEDFLVNFISAKAHDNILFFTSLGRVFQTKVYEIPASSRTSKGKSIFNFIELSSQENIRAIVSYNEKQSQKYLIMVTKNGLIKKTSLEDFKNIRRNGLIAIKIKKDDLLMDAKLSSGNDEIIIVTKNGLSIRFKEQEARSIGRNASGFLGIRLKSKDEVAGFDIMNNKDKEMKLLAVMENSFAKQTPLKDYRLQKRGGHGIKTAKVTEKTGKIISAQIITSQEEILALSARGQVLRTALSSIRTTSRAAQGVKIINLESKDKLVGIIII